MASEVQEIAHSFIQLRIRIANVDVHRANVIALLHQALSRCDPPSWYTWQNADFPHLVVVASLLLHQLKINLPGYARRMDRCKASVITAILQVSQVCLIHLVIPLWREAIPTASILILPACSVIARNATRTPLYASVQAFHFLLQLRPFRLLLLQLFPCS